MNMALALDARIRPPGQLMTKVIAGIEPAIVVEVDLDKSAENLIVASLESTGFTLTQLSALLHFIADAIGDPDRSRTFRGSTYEDEDGNEVLPDDVELAMKLREKLIAKYKKAEHENPPTD